MDDPDGKFARSKNCNNCTVGFNTIKFYYTKIESPILLATSSTSIQNLQRRFNLCPPSGN